MKKTLFAVLLGAAFASPVTTYAAANDPGAHFIFGMGLTGGGETLDTVHYSDGSSKNIKTGDFFNFGAGVLWQSANHPLATSLTANYHFDKANGSNGSVTFDRIPLEALAYYTGVEKWRFGGGVRFVQAPKYKLDVDSDHMSVKFKDTVGAVVEAGYGLSPNLWINLRYVSEKYKASSATVNGVSAAVTNPKSIDGSHVGVNMLFQF